MSDGEYTWIELGVARTGTYEEWTRALTSGHYSTDAHGRGYDPVTMVLDDHGVAHSRPQAADDLYGPAHGYSAHSATQQGHGYTPYGSDSPPAGGHTGDVFGHEVVQPAVLGHAAHQVDGFAYTSDGRLLGQLPAQGGPATSPFLGEHSTVPTGHQDFLGEHGAAQDGSGTTATGDDAGGTGHLTGGTGQHDDASSSHVSVDLGQADQHAAHHSASDGLGSDPGADHHESVTHDVSADHGTSFDDHG